MYPLGLSLFGDKISAGSLARAFALYTAMECVGSPMGASLMGAARDLWGGFAMFPVGAVALSTVLVAWTVVRFRTRPSSIQPAVAVAMDQSVAA
jgi:hypothetical protein